MCDHDNDKMQRMFTRDLNTLEQRSYTDTPMYSSHSAAQKV